MTGGSACSSAKSNNMTGGSACSSAKSNNMTGGSACSSAKSNNMTGGSACSSAKSNNMTGGSLASSYVENYANSKAQNQPLNEYTTQMDLPSMDNLKGGGCAGSILHGGKKTKRRSSKKSKRRGGWQKGGSACKAPVQQDGGSACKAPVQQDGGSACKAPVQQDGGSACKAPVQQDGGSAYNRVMSNLGEVKSSGMTGEMPAPVDDVKNMPRLYQLTGGRRRHSSKTKKRAGQRGGSFWNFAGYGNINAGPAMFKNDHYFTKDTSHPSWKDLMDPPTKEKAGTGDKQNLAVGASYPFN
jgi:hypothetical protein